MMLTYCRKHPLITTMLIAVVLRAVAVVFSKGYMASDDHFETIRVAYNWLIFGLWSPEGVLTWRDPIVREISRFPLYTLSLFGIMKAFLAAGIESLDTMMYGIRTVHALLSLISVYCVYRIVGVVTRSRDWALIAGLIAAAHAAMPFLAVRNLIEMVSGHFWILSLFLVYKYQSKNRDHMLFLAGLFAGLAWMIRFEIAFAILPVPLILWYEKKQLQPAIVYSVALLAMFMISGLTDRILIGSFAASTVNHIRQVLTESPPYASNLFIYPAVLLAFFLPPLSLIAFWLAGLRKFWINHRILFYSSATFFVAHLLSPSRQERYMIPIIPALIALLVLAFWWHRKNDGFLFRHRTAFGILVGIAAALNLLLLVPLTTNYAHKGLVEPLIQIEKGPQHSGVVFVMPEQGRIIPYFYAAYGGLRRGYAFNWNDLDRLEEENRKRPYEYYIVYPPSEQDIPRYLDSLSARFGVLEEWLHVGPSNVDYVLHAMNPKHNRTNEVWVYRPTRQPTP